MKTEINLSDFLNIFLCTYIKHVRFKISACSYVALFVNRNLMKEGKSNFPSVPSNNFVIILYIRCILFLGTTYTVEHKCRYLFNFAVFCSSCVIIVKHVINNTIY